MTAITMLISLGARRLHPLLPGALLAAVAGVVFSLNTGYTGPVLGEVAARLPPLSMAIPWAMGPELLLPGVVIALVGFAESAAIAQVFASRERARWNPDQEFLSQGVANLAAGIFSGFPVGGSFSRSSLNHLSGAVTRWSGAFTGVAVLLLLPFMSLLAPMPKAVLSGVVIAGVVGLIRPRQLIGLWKLSKVQALVAWATFALCILLSPRVEQAVLLGVLISLAAHVWRERRAAFDIEMEGRTLRIDARGVLWFASAPRLQEQILSELADAKDVDEVVIDLSGLGRIDLTGALVLRRILDEVGAVGVRGTLVEVPPHAAKILDNVIRLRPSEAPRR
jgi:SulP family sulfate permease